MTDTDSRQPATPEKTDSLAPPYFDQMYAANPDPWHFETSPYEADKYATTLSALPRDVYPRAFEIGCSIGVFTEQLARRCGHLLAVDVSAGALARAAARCQASHVTLQRMRFPEEQPTGAFDLIVISEIAYFWNSEDLERAMDAVSSHLAPGGHLVLVHWTPTVPDHPLTGDQVHDRWLQRQDYRPLHSLRRDLFRLDVLEKTG